MDLLGRNPQGHDREPEGKVMVRREGFRPPAQIADSDAAEAFVTAGNRLEGPGLGFLAILGGRSGCFATSSTPKSGKWSNEIAVAIQKGGDWEPSIAFDQEGHAFGLSTTARGATSST